VCGLVKASGFKVAFAISTNDPFKKRDERKWQTTVCSAGLLPFVTGSNPCCGALLKGVPKLSMDSDQAHRRAEALFKKEQQAREGQQAMAEYQAGLAAMREKNARLRALRLARDAANKKTPTAHKKGAA
jgi:hypothetical protein